jgi:flagellin
MISIQTNYAALVGEQNMNTNQVFQTKTIEALTSGYRINSSGDDAAGLAVANGYRNDVAALTQGVINANSAASQLQIMDGGLSNISTILDRLQTLATESASSTFTGDRTILNNEYQSLVTEINRQAANIGLNTAGTNATALTTYIGGGATQGNSEVTVDLTNSAVDATGLGLSGTNLLTAGTVDTGGSGAANAITDLNTASAVLTGGTTGDNQVFAFNLAGGGSFTATVSSATSAGISVADAIQQLNNTLNAHGLTASVDGTSGSLMISGGTAFTMTAGTNVVNAGGAVTAGSELATATSAIDSNGALDSFANQAFTAVDAADPQNVSFTSGGSTVSLQLTNLNAGTLASAAATLTTALASLGIQAVVDGAGALSLQSSSAFTATVAAAAGGKGFTGALSGAAGLAAASPTSTGSSTGNSLAAVTAVQAAVTALGAVQGTVGAGENTLQYAIDLANSQETNVTSAESQLRDADVATEAANLSKAQVLEQASVAAMAQANSTPQAVLKLLQ